MYTNAGKDFLSHLPVLFQLISVLTFRVFTFGIGSGASTALVNGIAKAGNGTSEFIKEGERMQPKVSKEFENEPMTLVLKRESCTVFAYKKSVTHRLP